MRMLREIVKNKFENFELDTSENKKNIDLAN